MGWRLHAPTNAKRSTARSEALRLLEALGDLSLGELGSTRTQREEICSGVGSSPYISKNLRMRGLDPSSSRSSTAMDAWVPALTKLPPKILFPPLPLH